MRLLFDYIINFLPKSIATKVSSKFVGNIDYGFLIHSRDYSDLYRRFPGLKKIVPFYLLRFIGRFMPPIRVGYISGLEHGSQRFKGVFIGSPMDSKDMLDNRDLAREKIAKAVKFAEKLGVGYVGLGALSASLTKNGNDLVSISQMSITTGHSYTAWVVCSNVLKIRKLSNRDLVICIVGAGGSIGSSCYNILEKNFNKFILIDKDKSRLADKLNLDSGKILYYGSEISMIKQADVIITATNAPYSLIRDSYQLKPNTIVVDDAQPLNASRRVNSLRRKTLVLEGGVCNLEGIRYSLDLGMLDSGDMFSCMGELVSIVALGSTFKTIGYTTAKKVLEISKIAGEVGLRGARFRSFGVLVEDSYIKEIFA